MVVFDDLALLGTMGAAILLLGGVAFVTLSLTDYQLLGQSLSDALYASAQTEEQTIVVTAVRQDLIEQARQAMNYNKAPVIPTGEFDFFINLAILMWIQSFIDGEKTLETDVTHVNGVTLHDWGQYFTAGSPVIMPQHPGTTELNSFTVNNTDFNLYRTWSLTKGSSFVESYYTYILIADGDIDFDITVSNTRVHAAYYPDDHLIEANGQYYSWAFVEIHDAATLNSSDFKEFEAYRSGCYVTKDYRLGISYSSENSKYGPLEEKILGGTIVKPDYEKASREPDLITGGIKNYLDNGGSLTDIQLPNMDLTGVMDYDKTLDEIINGVGSSVVDGSQTWQEYVDTVTPSGDITDSSGNVINESGVTTDPGTDPDSGSGSWTPSGPMGNFTLDLKQYFPFCIPFDLYAFFTCLDADPVAPVIDWIIPMPGGGSYPFQIDLSVFDSVAQTLRRLQLLLFCVGLAFKTRDLIKG